MPSPRLLLFWLLAGFTSGALAQPFYRDVNDDALPRESTRLRSMDAEMGDVDGDGDLDILVAMEFSQNLLLINRGDGTFTDGSDQLPDAVHDSEDIALGDFDADGDLDAVIVSEDDQTDLYYRNDGEGRFVIADLPPAAITNGIAQGDVDHDGDIDLVLANATHNALWLNDGGSFTLAPAAIPPKEVVSQDVQLGDVDGDGDLDLVEANEGPNRILLNDGTGTFSVVTNALADTPARESRQAAFGDVDADGDLDVIFGNVSLGHARRQAEAGVAIGYANRLFLNHGDGTFVQSAELTTEEYNSPHIDLLDLDGDGDLDILATDVIAFREAGNGRVRAYLNDGTGGFEDGTDQMLPQTFRGNGWDVTMGDVNGDGKPDIYLANRIGEDRLLLAR